MELLEEELPSNKIANFLIDELNISQEIEEICLIKIHKVLMKIKGYWIEGNQT